MPRFFSKTALAILLAVFTFVILDNVPAQAADSETASTNGSGVASSVSESHLQQILANVNKLPIYLTQLTLMALSWLAPDNSETTAKLQNSFASLLKAKLQTAQAQLNNQYDFLSHALQHASNSKTKDLPGDIIYPAALLHAPYFSKDQTENTARNYTEYAAGLNLLHSKPEAGWNEPNNRQHPARLMYARYYNTTSAVQTYNGYILSELYENAKNNNSSKQTQDDLIKRVSNSNWFAEIASENLGVVLRQILLFNSQTYVLLAQLLETQKKLLVSQTMNNALLIAVNQEAENRIYSKAKGQASI